MLGLLESTVWVRTVIVNDYDPFPFLPMHVEMIIIYIYVFTYRHIELYLAHFPFSTIAPSYDPGHYVFLGADGQGKYFWARYDKM